MAFRQGKPYCKNPTDTFQLDPTKMFLQVAYPPLALYFYKTQFSFYLTLDLVQFPSGHLAIVP